MAVDEALLRAVKQPILRIYEWDRPAVSIGYFQSMAVVPSGREFIRRYTGGGLVDHLADVTYTVILPRGESVLDLSTTESYRQIHEAVVKSLQMLGVAAVLTPCCDPEERDSCFERAVKYDIVLGEDKVAGAAQRRTREGMLQQGSVLLKDEELREKLRVKLPLFFAEVFGVSFEEEELSAAEREATRKLEESRYGTLEWNQQK